MLSYPNSLILRQAKNISTSYINPTSESHKLRNRKHRYKYPLELWSRNQRGMGQKHLAQWGLTCSPYGPEPMGPMISTQILKFFEKNRLEWFLENQPVHAVWQFDHWFEQFNPGSIQEWFN